MTSCKPSNPVDKSCFSSNIHSILNPIRINTSDGASQRGSDLCQHPLCLSPWFVSSQVDWTDSILNHRCSQNSRPQAIALHAVSLGRSNSPETVKAQQCPSTTFEGEIDTMRPGPSPLPPVSTPVHSPSASRNTSQFPSNHISHLSISPRCGIAAPQQSSRTYQASTCSTSFPTPVAPPALPSHGAVGSQAQSSHSLRTPDGLTQIPVDLKSGSRSSDKIRKRNAEASARFRQRRTVKERENAQAVAELEQRVRDLTKLCEFYREERDYYCNLVKSGADLRIGSSRTPSSRFFNNL
jgi:hypothetical protein